MKPYLVGLTACLALAGCSSDDLAEGNAPVSGLDGDAYVTLKIADADSRKFSPAMRDGVEDLGFALGDEKEDKVYSARFFFYDKDGKFLVEGKQASDLGMTQSKETGNISSTAEVTLVLDKDELANATPTQVVAIVNGSTLDANDYSTLENLQKVMSSSVWTDVQTSSNSEGTNTATTDNATTTTQSTGMVMSNSVYVDNQGTKQFATPVETYNIQGSEDDSKKYPVDIYVERLGAKVELAFGDSFDGTVTVENVQYYDDKAETYKKGNITIKVDAWGLNAVNKDAFLIKNTTGLTWTSPWTGWSVPTDFRCHWAVDNNYSYSDTAYPLMYGNGKSQLLKDMQSAALQYNAYNTLTTDISKSDAQKWIYCQENTIAGLKGTQYMAATTHVLLKGTMSIAEATQSDADQSQSTTRVKEGNEGSAAATTAQTWIRFKGVYFSEASFLKAAVSELNNRYSIYVQKGEEKNPSTTDDWKIVNAYDGFVTVAPGENVTFVDEEGKTIDASTIKTYTESLSKAYGYKNGQLYYYAPIESHYTTETTTAAEGDDSNVIPTGKYGIVRNHWHELTVSAIKGIGTPVWDVNEAIVPHPDEESYFVSARLKVLSWHKIKQNVTIGQ